MARKPKKKSQTSHAKRRASARYGINLHQNQMLELVRLIQSGDKERCRFLESQSNRITKFALLIDNEWVPVIYDKKRKVIVTFLPEEALDNHQELDN